MQTQTTFIIPTIGRDSLQTAIRSAERALSYAGMPTDNIIVAPDKKREGEGVVRQRAILKAKTEWVSMLDDDDTVSPWYCHRLAQEVNEHQDKDVVLFRELTETGRIMPDNDFRVKFANVGIAFSARKSLFEKYPFESEPHEDFHWLSRIPEDKIHWSRWCVYFMKQDARWTFC